MNDDEDECKYKFLFATKEKICTQMMTPGGPQTEVYLLSTLKPADYHSLTHSFTAERYYFCHHDATTAAVKQQLSKLSAINEWMQAKRQIMFLVDSFLNQKKLSARFLLCYSVVLLLIRKKSQSM